MASRYCFAITLLLLVGCEDSPSAVQALQEKKDLPVQKFDWAMQRLERAVTEFRPSAQVGLRVGKRKVDYKLFPPSETKPQYTARVTIESETVYVHTEELQTTDTEKKREERREQRRLQRELRRQAEEDSQDKNYDDPLAEKFAEQMEELAAKSSVPIVPEASIGNQKTSERKVYELAYLDNRWQLQTEPESDHERLWFDYALETNRHSSSD